MKARILQVREIDGRRYGFLEPIEIEGLKVGDHVMISMPTTQPKAPQPTLAASPPPSKDTPASSHPQAPEPTPIRAAPSQPSQRFNPDDLDVIG